MKPSQDDVIWIVVGVVMFLVAIVVWSVYFAVVWRPL